jgi:ATP synthase mitochondrial F1 complex assembly factor 1
MCVCFPSKFIIQPVFREGGHFMLVSEFQKPHFLLSYQEDYQTNPGGATPIVTASLFDDFHGKDLTLVRCDYDAKLIGDAPQAMQCILNNYLVDYETIETFNHKAESFNIDSFVATAKEKWHGAM